MSERARWHSQLSPGKRDPMTRRTTIDAGHGDIAVLDKVGSWWMAVIGGLGHIVTAADRSTAAAATAIHSSQKQRPFRLDPLQPLASRPNLNYHMHWPQKQGCYSLRGES